MNRHIKIIMSGADMVVASWWLAFFWSAHGSWWVAHRPARMLTAIYSVAKPILSTEVWEAEEQIDFLSFWLPTLVVLVLMPFLFWRLRSIFQAKK